jgi:hypothetical protein
MQFGVLAQRMADASKLDSPQEYFKQVLEPNYNAFMGEMIWPPAELAKAVTSLQRPTPAIPTRDYFYLDRGRHRSPLAVEIADAILGSRSACRLRLAVKR